MFDFIRRLDKQDRLLLYSCFLAYFVNGTLSLMMGSILPDMKVAYGLSDTVSGLFLSAHSAGNLIAGFLSGLVPLWLASRKRSIIVLALLIAIGFGMVLLWGNPAWLFVAFLCIGMGRGSVNNFNNRTVNQLSGGSTAASNILHATFAVGAILSPVMFLALRRFFPWQSGPLYVIFWSCMSLLLFFRIRIKDDKPDRNDRRNSTLEFLKDVRFLVLALMMLCYMCTEYAVNGWLVTYIQHKDSLIVSLSAGGGVTAFSQTMATLLWFVMLIGRLVCAAAASKVGRKQWMMYSAIGSAAFFLLLLTANTMIVVTAAVIGLGFCMAGISPTIYADAAWYTNTYSMATSAILTIGSTGAILMPTLVGALAERFDFGAGMGAIFVAVVLLVGFSAANVLLARKGNGQNA